MAAAERHGRADLKSLVVDAGNAAQGYILARGKGKQKAAQAARDAGTIQADLRFEHGGGIRGLSAAARRRQLTVELFENVSGKKYAAEGKVTVRVKLDDPYAPFLGPNQYVHYTQGTEAVKTSMRLRGHDGRSGDLWETIRGYIKANYMYDYVKAAAKLRAAPCRISTAAMKENGNLSGSGGAGGLLLRVQGVPTRLMVGYAGKMYHAWNSVVIDGEEVLYDPTLELSAIKSGQTYTTGGIIERGRGNRAGSAKYRTFDSNSKGKDAHHGKQGSRPDAHRAEQLLLGNLP